jgi:hypothetical protein
VNPDPDLLIIVPSRGRPHSFPRMVDAWLDTGAFHQGAALLFALDADDTTVDEYLQLARLPAGSNLPVGVTVAPAWQPMVAKLNRVAFQHASGPFALGFFGDDHVPRTFGWATRYLEELRDLGTGIVYGDDLLQGENLPTQWAMTSDIVHMLGRMVPSGVEHLYCDNVIKLLGDRAECLRYLPDVTIEHVHFTNAKAPLDEGYLRVNRPEQYRLDFDAFQRWQASQLAGQAEDIRKLSARRSRA